MSTTLENLKEAFAGESQAFQKYKAFAKKADKGHFGAQDGVGSTADNLKAAIAGETYEFTHMYPPMAEQANADNHKAKRMFNYALKVEAVHAQLYKLALQAVEQGKDLDVSEIYICPVCGNIEFGKPTENCSVCGLPAAKFIKL